MISEKWLQKSESFLLKLFIDLNFLEALTNDWSKQESWELSECIVLIIFTNRKIYEMPCNAIKVDLHESI